MKFDKKIVIGVVVFVFLLAAIGAGVYLALNPQTFFSQAQQGATGAVSSCPAPGTPATVTVSYPLCEAGQSGESCQFDKAGCDWNSVSGAAKYNIKVTEVETGAIIKTDSVTALKTSFPVVQGRTYKCEVSAVSNCGAVGGTNEDSLLCQTDAFVSPAPSPSQAPAAAPPPPAPPPPAPTPTPVACGFRGCSTSIPCLTGYICIEANGGNYCTKTEYQGYCAGNPSEATCCQPPAQPKPTLPPAGAIDQTLIIGGAGVGLVILGAAALLLL